MSGEVQPRRRRDRKKRKARLGKEEWNEGKVLYGSEDAEQDEVPESHHICLDPGPNASDLDYSNSNSEEEEESREEPADSGGPGMTYKIFLFALLVVLGVALGLLLVDNPSPGEVLDQNTGLDSSAEVHDEPVSISTAAPEVNQMWPPGGQHLEDDKGDVLEEIPERDDGVSSLFDTIGGLIHDFLEVDNAGNGYDTESIIESPPAPESPNPSEDAQVDETEDSNIKSQLGADTEEALKHSEETVGGAEQSFHRLDASSEQAEPGASESMNPSEEIGNWVDTPAVIETPSEQILDLVKEAERSHKVDDAGLNDGHEQTQDGGKVATEFGTDSGGEIWKATEIPDESFETQIQQPLDTDAWSPASSAQMPESTNHETGSEGVPPIISTGTPHPQDIDLKQPENEPAFLENSAIPKEALDDIPNPKPDGGVTQDEILVDGML